MSEKMDNRVAIITGAAGGIGAASARRLAADGATVILADIDAKAVEAIAGTISGSHAYRVDLTVEESVQ